MKILLINPDCEKEKTLGAFKPFMSPVAPLGLAYMASVLKKEGFYVRVMDQFATGERNSSIADYVKREGFDVVGISCLTPSMRTVTDLIQNLRDRNRDLKIILGNVHASVFAEDLVLDGFADVVVHGEGEKTVVGVIRTISGNNGDLETVAGISVPDGNGGVKTTPVRPPIKDLDSLPYPAWELFDIPRYKAPPMLSFTHVILPIQASRGCPFSCFFCSQNYMSKGVRKRELSLVVDEVEYLHRVFGLKYFGFVDALFPITKDQGLKFCEEFMRRGLHREMRWITESNVNKVDYELLKAMKDAGLRLIMYGFETGNEGVMKTVGKNTTMDDSLRAMEATRRAGILTFGLFMLGLPGENRGTCIQTIEFAKKLDPDIAKFNIVVPYPGSRLFDMYRERMGDMDNPEKFTGWYVPGPGEELAFCPDGMDSKELLRLQRKALYSFYLRPRHFIRNLLKGTITLKTLLSGTLIPFRWMFGKK